MRWDAILGAGRYADIVTFAFISSILLLSQALNSFGLLKMLPHASFSILVIGFPYCAT